MSYDTLILLLDVFCKEHKLPSFVFEEDNGGQVVIYTGLQVSPDQNRHLSEYINNEEEVKS